jgi:thioredoxin 1
MSEKLIELTDATFDEVVNSSDGPVLVDFWAPWCGPCKMIAPIVEELAGEYGENAKICKVNTDEHREAAVEYAINAIPTVILFNNGQIEKKWVGMTTKKDMVAEIDAVIASAAEEAEETEEGSEE